jgi:hypothetical protein
MISFLVDGVLLLALLVTTWRVGVVYRELRSLRAHQGQYQAALGESVQALLKAQASIEAVHAEGGRTLTAMAAATQEAREILTELDGLAEGLTSACESAVAARVEPSSLLRDALAHAGFHPSQTPSAGASARASHAADRRSVAAPAIEAPVRPAAKAAASQ